MHKRTVTNIGFLLENCEEIWFSPSDFISYEVDFGHEKMVLMNQTFLQIRTLDFLDVSIKATANHTYNSFGKASEVTNFNRLLDCHDITALLIRTETDERNYYCEDDVLTSVVLDLEGNLNVTLVHAEDIMDAPCECECECCCEDTEEF